MKIGYACLTIGLSQGNFRTCIMKNASEELLLELIEYNLNSLENIIDYNIEKGIDLFRISSDIIPFGSSQVNRIAWWELFQEKLLSIGKKIKDSGMRVSMHPGQYTVVNSPKEDVVFRAIKDLEYHNRFLDSLGVGREGKIVLHIGGVYGDRQAAVERFIHNYDLLSKGIKERLVIENDDRSYNIEQVLEIGHRLNIPVVYDNLHNQVLNPDPGKDDNYWIKEANKTWKKEDGRQKIHYSQQDPNKKPGGHSSTIRIEEFRDFIKNLDQDIDIMLEVKDKNLSAIKAKNLITEARKIKNLELEWASYKYNILEHSPLHYNQIRQLLKDKSNYPIVEFYKLIEEALDIEITKGNFINGAQHVWGYFKEEASDKEREEFKSILEKFREDKKSVKSVKKLLLKMAKKYDEKYLLDSLYFDF